MGLFDFLIKLNNSFFDGLKENAIKNAVKVAKNGVPSKGKSKPSKKTGSRLVSRMSELDKAAKELEQMLKDYDLSPEEELMLENKRRENMNNLINRLFVGMTYEELIKTQPNHDKKKSTVTNGKETIKLFYGQKENRLGNDSYEFEITLKEGLVVGWKDLSNVGTRNF
jgi:hypothetical protein